MVIDSNALPDCDTETVTVTLMEPVPMLETVERADAEGDGVLLKERVLVTDCVGETVAVAHVEGTPERVRETETVLDTDMVVDLFADAVRVPTLLADGDPEIMLDLVTVPLVERDVVTRDVPEAVDDICPDDDLDCCEEPVTEGDALGDTDAELLPVSELDGLGEIVSDAVADCVAASVPCKRRIRRTASRVSPLLISPPSSSNKRREAGSGTASVNADVDASSASVPVLPFVGSVPPVPEPVPVPVGDNASPFVIKNGGGIFDTEPKRTTPPEIAPLRTATASSATAEVIRARSVSPLAPSTGDIGKGAVTRNNNKLTKINRLILTGHMKTNRAKEKQTEKGRKGVQTNVRRPACPKFVCLFVLEQTLFLQTLFNFFLTRIFDKQGFCDKQGF